VYQPGKKAHEAMPGDHVTRLRIACKAPVAIGDGVRGGRTRGDPQACDHDLGLHERYSPCGSVAADSAPRPRPLGSAAKTSESIVDARAAWGAAWEEAEQGAMARWQSKMAHGPARSGRRTQFLPRMGQWADQSGKPIHLLSAPP